MQAAKKNGGDMHFFSAHVLLDITKEHLGFLGMRMRLALFGSAVLSGVCLLAALLAMLLCRDINATANKRNGLLLLASAYRLLEAVHAGSGTNSQMFPDKAAATGRSSKDKQIAVALNQLVAQHRLVGGALNSASDLAQLGAAFTSPVLSAPTTPAIRCAQTGGQAGAVMRFMMVINEKSGLLGDGSLDVSRMSELLTSQLPKLIVAIGTVRQLAEGSVAGGASGPCSLYPHEPRFALALAEQRLANAVQHLLETSPDLYPIKAQTRRLLTDTQHLEAVYDSHRVNGRLPRAAPADVLLSADQATLSAGALFDALRPHLDQQLATRMTTQRARMAFALGTVVTLALTALYLLVGGYLSIVQSLRSLEWTVRPMHAETESGDSIVG